jgi:NAD(P)-dependent dehydrogenase (short-subunit alcohol dehydrogenase family)
MKNFKDKVAVVTGGASGVGRSIAARLGREGAKLVLADIERKALDKTVAEFKAQGFDAIGVITDVTQYQSVEALAEQSFGHYGAVHLLFNNAGVGPTEAPNLWDAPLKEWAWGMNVNVWGVIHGIKAFMPRLVAQNQEAHVVNTTSGNGGLNFQPFTPIYAATKAAVTAITEVLHFQLSAQQSPIKVAALFPGPHVVDTGIYNSERNRPKELEDASLSVKSVHSLEEMKAQIASFGLEIQVTTPDEVAETVYQSLLKDEYWILPMTEPLVAAVRARMEDLLARKNPVHRDVL